MGDPIAMVDGSIGIWLDRPAHVASCSSALV